MKQWTKNQKIVLAAVFILILAAVGITAGILNMRETQAGIKHFQVVVTSERDGYEKTTDCQSEEEFLGAFIRTFQECEWEESDYGIYIKGFDGMQEDIEQQYWWCVMVNGESAVTGADEIPLQEGAVYSFVLKQGW